MRDPADASPALYDTRFAPGADRVLRLLVEHAPAAIAMLDRELRYVAVSRRWLADYRLGDVEVIGRSHYELFPDLPERWREIHRRCLAGAVERCDDDPFPRSDGKVDWVRWEIRPWRDEDGEIGGIILFTEVVTAQKEAELALRASEARLQAVVESMSEGVAICDLDGRFTFGNRAVLELHDLPEAPPGGLLLTDLAARFDLLDAAGHVLPPDRWPAARILAGERTGSEEHVVRARDGRWTRRYVYRGALARDGAGRPQFVVLTVTDVTDERRLEAQVREAHKLESVGRLAGGIAHDFNNLCTVILSCAEALRQDLADGLPASAEDVAEIAGAGKRAAELTRQLLTFARRQTFAPDVLDVDRAVRGARALLERLLGDDVRVVEDLDAAACVRCDPVQLDHVFMNLAVNARDAMPRGGVLTLETRAVVLEPAQARAADVEPGRHVRLTVRDTGHGMTADVKAHLFEPFFTTKAPGAGTGLGLATVYGIVKQSGGGVAVESTPGAGTAVHVYLPRADPAPS